MAVGHVHECDCGARWDEEVGEPATSDRWQAQTTESDRLCHGCGGVIVGRTRAASYCSEECRLAHWARRREPAFRGGVR